MHIIEIIPATKIPFPHQQILTYYHTAPLKRGALVEVVLNKRTVTGITLNCRPFSKMEIRQADFQLKPVKRVISENEILDESQIMLVKWLKNYYWAPSSLLVKTILPSALLKPTKPVVEKLNQKLKSAPAVRKDKEKESAGLPPEVFTGDFSERAEFYKKLIAAKAGQGAILFLAPENYHLSLWRKKLSGDTDSLLVWRGQNTEDPAAKPLTPKEQFNQWLKIKKGYRGIILGTRGAVFAPFRKLSLIIVDEEENTSYKSWDMRPYYNGRETALELSRIHHCPIVLGAQLPSVETFHRCGQDGTCSGIVRPPRKILVADMREEIKNGNYSVFSRTLAEKIKTSRKTLLFINRRGHSAFIMCRDCGHVPQCPRCSVPLVYHLDNRWLICHHCNTFQKPFSLCPVCQSHRVKFFGAGTQRVEEEIKKDFPEIKAERLDGDITPNLSGQTAAIGRFAGGETNALIATRLVLKFLRLLKPEIIGIISIETLLHLPDFSGAEKTFQMLYKLSQAASNDFILQTYHPESYVIKNLTQNGIAGFYQSELAGREELGYPPFAQIIKLVYEHRDFQYARQESMILAEKLKAAFSRPGLPPKQANSEESARQVLPSDYEILGPAPTFISRKKGRHIWQIILKIKNLKDGSIKRDLLRLVPKDWKIDVDPVEIL